MEWFKDHEVLRSKRRELRCSQKQLASRVGIQQSVLAEIETGKRPFSESYQRRLWPALAELEIAQKNPPRLVQLTKLSEINPSQNDVARPPFEGDSSSVRANFEAGRLEQRVADQQERMSTMEKLIEKLSGMLEISDQLINVYKAALADAKKSNPDWAAKDAAIGDLEAENEKLRSKNLELKNLYELETDAAETFDKARKLREKIEEQIK